MRRERDIFSFPLRVRSGDRMGQWPRPTSIASRESRVVGQIWPGRPCEPAERRSAPSPCISYRCSLSGSRRSLAISMRPEESWSRARKGWTLGMSTGTLALLVGAGLGIILEREHG